MDPQVRIRMKAGYPIEHDDMSDLVEFREAFFEARRESLEKSIDGLNRDAGKSKLSILKKVSLKGKGIWKGKGKGMVKQPSFEMPPPIYSDELGEIDVSEACKITLDGHSLKYSNEDRYQALLEFWYDCSGKHALQLFTHPGHDSEGGLLPHEGEELEDDYYQDHALRAIAIFNNNSEDMRLKLVKLHKVNTTIGLCGFLYYMTFTAKDVRTGFSSIFQAVLSKSHRYGEVLGLFRDSKMDKTLAIMHLIGGEEDLEARQKEVKEARHGASKQHSKGKHGKYRN